MALQALPHCWAHLAGVSGGEKTYLGSIIITIIYPAVSLVIGGRDGMDGRRRIWMTCSIYRTRHQSLRLGIIFVVGDVGGVFFHRIYTYMSSYNIYIPIPPFPVHQGWQERMDGVTWVWMMFR